tara:strand:+ start:118 stop:633 length:516 start_codon:yes stop_codon:yes gene_type:complete
MAELAEIKGISKAAVSKRVKSGRLDAAIVLVGGKKKLNKDVALDIWENTTDIQRTAIQQQGLTPEQKNELLNVIDELPAEEIPDFNTSRAKKMYYDAKLAEIEVNFKNKELVDAKETERKGFEIAKSMSSKLMSLPERVSALFASETDAASIGKVLKEELYNCIDEVVKTA